MGDARRKYTAHHVLSPWKLALAAHDMPEGTRFDAVSPRERKGLVRSAEQVYRTGGRTLADVVQLPKKLRGDHQDEYTCRLSGHNYRTFPGLRRCVVCGDDQESNVIGRVPEYVAQGEVTIGGLMSCLAIFMVKVSEDGRIEGFAAGHFVSLEMLTSPEPGKRTMSDEGRVFFLRMLKLGHDHGIDEARDAVWILTRNERSKGNERRTVRKYLRNNLRVPVRNIIMKKCPGSCQLRVGDNISSLDRWQGSPEKSRSSSRDSPKRNKSKSDS